MKESNEINSLPIQTSKEYIFQKEENENETKQKEVKKEKIENIPVPNEIYELISYGDESENLLKEKKINYKIDLKIYIKSFLNLVI